MEKKSAFGPSLMSGIYLGIVLIVFSLVLFLLEVDYESHLTKLSWLILVVGLAWSIYNFRNKHMGGYIEYKTAFAAGFYTGLFAALISGIFTFFYVQYIDTGLVQEVLLRSEEQMITQYPDMSDEQLDQALSMTELFTTPIMMSIMAFIINLFMSTVFSLIIAIFAKRENKELA